MAEISVNNLNKFFGENHVLKDISFEIYSGERVGLIGQNGSGKTTLFKILTGREEHDSGELYINKNGRVGLLEQLPEYPPDVTARQVLMSAFDHLTEMEDKLRDLEGRMEEEGVMEEYSRLTALFEAQGGYEYMTRYNMMTNGLSIPQDMQDRPFMSLSGGEKTRVNLARIMLSGTDILLLDEPTNHLDLDTISWLEGYLKTYKGTAVIISHDRYFLDEATTRTLELEDGHITSYPGNYSYYIDRKEEMREQLEAAKKRQDKEIAKLEFTIERMKGWGLGNKKVMKRAFAMEKRLDRIERIETMRSQRKMKNRFSQADGSGDEVYTISGLTVGYDKPLLTEPFDALVLRGERIALLGPNGCGKTTMLKTILGQLSPMSGVVLDGVGVKTGYLPQVVSFDHPERTLVDTLIYETDCSTQAARDRLAAFGFRGEEVFKTVDVLSGGEKTRLKLCLFMSDSVNTLFLDEPTNHLDILSREWLEESIDDFSETMIFVSHDRYFINRFATRVWQVEDGKILDYSGNYDEFLKKREIERLRRLAAPQPKEEKKEKPVFQKANRASQKAKKELEREIKAVEKRLSEIDEEMNASPDDYVLLAKLVEEKEGLEERLLELYELESEAI